MYAMLYGIKLGRLQLPACITAASARCICDASLHDVFRMRLGPCQRTDPQRQPDFLSNEWCWNCYAGMVTGCKKLTLFKTEQFAALPD